MVISFYDLLMDSFPLYFFRSLVASNLYERVFPCTITKKQELQKITLRLLPQMNNLPRFFMHIKPEAFLDIIIIPMGNITNNTILDPGTATKSQKIDTLFLVGRINVTNVEHIKRDSDLCDEQRKRPPAIRLILFLFSC